MPTIDEGLTPGVIIKVSFPTAARIFTVSKGEQTIAPAPAETDNFARLVADCIDG